MEKEILRYFANQISDQWIKIIISGNVIEVYRYERMPIFGNDKKADRKDVEEYIDKEKQDYQTHNDRRSKWNFIRLTNANFGAHSKFITLTFADNVQDLDQAHKEFDKFIKRMRRRYGKFKYAVAIEFQKRGAVHYHMMSDLPYIPKQELAKIWGQGFVRINDIKHVDNVGAYLSKYMTKGDGRDPRLRGRKMYLTSKNLDRPLVLKGDDADLIIEQYDLKNKKTVLETAYVSEHHGLISYKQYNLKRLEEKPRQLSG